MKIYVSRNTIAQAKALIGTEGNEAAGEASREGAENKDTGIKLVQSSTSLNAEEEDYLPSLLGLEGLVLFSWVPVCTREEVGEAKARGTRETPMCVVAQW